MDVIFVFDMGCCFCVWAGSGQNLTALNSIECTKDAGFWRKIPRSPNQLCQMLPQEPITPMSQQHELTVRLLLPRQAGLLAFWQRARNEADQELLVRQPFKSGKAYPLGQCLEIARRVFGIVEGWLCSPSPLFSPALSPAEQQGLEALREFFAAGGLLRLVWGALRGQYFQNAMQLGSLYVDVANDTVYREKPPVEILPFQDCGLLAIRDFFHFADIARLYWGGELFPNHLFPHLAPWFPWISVVPGTGVQLEAGNDYMIALTRQDGFRSAQRVLEQSSAPAALTAVIAPFFAETTLGFSADGRAAALAGCETLRQTLPDDAQRDRVVRAFLEINARLSRIVVRKDQPAGALPADASLKVISRPSLKN